MFVYELSYCRFESSCSHLKTSDLALALSREFFDIQATIECEFTLKRVRDMIRTYSQNCLDSKKEAYVDIFEIRKSINAGSGQESSIYIILTNETQQYIKMFNTKLSKLIYLPYHIFFWVVETYLFLNVVNFHYIFRQSF